MTAALAFENIALYLCFVLIMAALYVSQEMSLGG